ncbi:hypothetical protein ABN034_21915 [Actinopolymorpha sp. B11F2]|uniref:hypothetical protein n=1 Tax=Actinopolymorpha sp. B11F2 TaxID=3160862 RepID=UPI0032E4F05A
MRGCSALATELGVDPARATRALHVAILQERLPGPADLGPVAALRSGSGPAAVTAGTPAPAGTPVLAGTPTLVLTAGPTLLLVVGATGAAAGAGAAGGPGAATTEALERQVAELIRFARSMGCVVVQAPLHPWCRLLRTS